MSRLLPIFLFASALCAQNSAPAAGRWNDLRFLTGEWTGEGGGSTGPGAGAYTFLPELDGTVLVRRNTADYPAANGRPAIHHEDVMTVYREAADKAPEAIYFDNEGHVIHYAVEIDPAAKTARFLSPVQPGQPRYRLTYRETAPGVVAGMFEIAPPGKPESFAKYMEWSARRKR
jgi:hypothetical protein